VLCSLIGNPPFLFFDNLILLYTGMDFFLKSDFVEPPFRISHKDSLLLIGSCFTSNVGRELENLKFDVCHNPTGILFDPFSVTRHLRDALEFREYNTADLTMRDEVWHSMNHHTDFSSTDAEEAIDKINRAVRQTGNMIRKTSVLFVTLGSAYYYRLAESGIRVANCHRFPAGIFTKELAGITEITAELSELMHAVLEVNPSARFVFTVSPVRHIREGVVNNNRSKARLLESVHQLCDMFSSAYYFPAYELVIDVLRDYRFYDVDLVHPNYSATSFVFEKFKEAFFSEETKEHVKEIAEVMTAFRHKPNFPTTSAHSRFLQVQLEKIDRLKAVLPCTDWSVQEAFFRVGV
jgi:hypothetical protein